MPELRGGTLRTLYLSCPSFRPSRPSRSPIRAVGTPRLTLEAISVFIADAETWIVHDVRVMGYSRLRGTCYDVGGSLHDGGGIHAPLMVLGEQFSGEKHGYGGFSIDDRFAKTLGHAFAGEPVEVDATYVGDDPIAPCLSVAIVGIRRETDVQDHVHDPSPIRIRNLDLSTVAHV